MAAKLKHKAWLIGISVIVIAAICAPAVAKNARANAQESTASLKVQSPTEAPEKPEAEDNLNQSVDMSQQSIDKSRADDNMLTANVCLADEVDRWPHEAGELIRVGFSISNTSISNFSGIRIKALDVPDGVSFYAANTFSDVGNDCDGRVVWDFPCSIPSQDNLCDEIELKSSKVGNCSISFGFYRMDDGLPLVDHSGDPLIQTITLSIQEPRDNSIPSNLTIH